MQLVYFAPGFPAPVVLETELAALTQAGMYQYGRVKPCRVIFSARDMASQRLRGGPMQPGGGFWTANMMPDDYLVQYELGQLDPRNAPPWGAGGGP